MMKTTALFFALLFSITGDWTLEKDESGIKVYTRAVPGQQLKAFRAVMEVAASPDQVLAILTDADKGEEWMDRISDGRLLRRIGDHSYISYSVIDFPWPLDDRDIVVKVDIAREGETIICTHTNAPDAYPRQASIIRIPKYQGKWTLEKLSNGGCRVTNEGSSSPGGSVPDWLANSGVVDSPFNTLTNLRKRLGQ
ncbi:MAG: START domain-containing protein [Bacteroidia bacterium]|nr:START domain-containing protein [Bacteroidia bacterium]